MTASTRIKPTRPSHKPKRLHQFKVTLSEVRPLVWRRILVPSGYSFWDLHVAIQDAMGWLDSHLHVFHVRDLDTREMLEVGIPNDDAFEGEQPTLPGWHVPIESVFREKGDRAQYDYDFGDSWEHQVVLEKILDAEPAKRYPKCIAGARACPPEDCGGVPGYGELLRVIADPSDEEHESTLEWLGGDFDPEAFDPTRVRFDDPKKRWRTAFGRRS